MLTIVATPIGNLKDITLRALEALKDCDAIICEDTRRASILLNHYEIKKPLIVLNDYHEVDQIEDILSSLENDLNMCLISDAGTPLVADPGYKLIRECIKRNIQVDSLPGPSAVTTALTLSGLPPDKYLFLGYPPEKPGHRKDFFGKLEIIFTKMPMTFILFVSPHKLEGTLHDMENAYGDIEIVLAKELTKIYQKVQQKKISDWLKELKKAKGEYVMLFRIK
jgi:16S rRNA (cytidine1402-2'-O)-methyltransferase